MVNVARAKKGGKKLTKGVKALTGSLNAKGFKGNGGTRKLINEGKAVGRKSQSKAKKMGF